jgi:hypothetical protein
MRTRLRRGRNLPLLDPTVSGEGFLSLIYAAACTCIRASGDNNDWSFIIGSQRACPRGRALADAYWLPEQFFDMLRSLVVIVHQVTV